MDRALTLVELADAAADLLDGDGDEAARVRPTPRALRYYAAQRLLDPPLELRGPHSAYYGRRHLLQVVAVKRLQAGGRSLNEIRTMLAGATEQRLQELAGMAIEPGGRTGAREIAGSAAASPAPPRRAEAFWRARPDPDAHVPPPPDIRPAAPLLVGVPVGPVVVLLPAARHIDEADAAALVATAQPLLAMLADRGLLAPPAPATGPAPATTDPAPATTVPAETTPARQRSSP